MSNIIFYDGECGFCNQSVLWILKKDRDARFIFASLHSEYAHSFLQDKLNQTSPDSLIVTIDGKTYFYSDAVLVIASMLPAPYHYAKLLSFIPKSWRDLIYRFIARHRHRLFGRNNRCEIVDSSLKSRFLE